MRRGQRRVGETRVLVAAVARGDAMMPVGARRWWPGDSSGQSPKKGGGNPFLCTTTFSLKPLEDNSSLLSCS